jgi:hypothetical protein
VCGAAKYFVKTIIDTIYKRNRASALASTEALLIIMVAPPRIELGTQGFSVPCSTN